MTPEQRQQAAEAIAATVLELVVSAPAVVVFASFGSEVPTDPIAAGLLEKGTTVLVPWVDGDRLRASRISSLDELSPGYRGIREPARREPADPEGAVLVPGVAFDPSGARLGYGGGFFDDFLRTAENARPRIGLCFDCQIVERIPTEAHDEPVDVVVTESRIIRR